MPEETKSISSEMLDTGQIITRLNAYSTLATRNPDSILLLCDPLLQASHKRDFAYGKAGTKLIMTDIFRYKGDYARALEQGADAILFCRQSPNAMRILALVYNQIGHVYMAMGKKDTAARFYFLALRSIHQVDRSNLDLAHVYNNLAAVLSNPKRSLYYLQLADSISLQKKPGGDGFTLINTAIHYMRDKNWDKCQEYLHRAYNAALLQQDTILQYRTLIKFSDLYNDMNDPGRALTYISQASRLMPDGDVEIYQKNANHFHIGQVYFQLKKYTEAEYYWKMALKTGKVLHINDQVAETHKSLSQLYAQTGKSAQAYEHLQAYIQLKDSLTSSQIVKDIHLLEVKYQTAEKDKQIASQQHHAERKNFLITAVASGAGILLILLFILYRHAKQKQKMLQQEQEIGQLKNVMKGEEKERGRIAQELHDGIGGMLGAVKMQASRIKDNPQQEGFNALMQMIDETAVEVRRTSHNLLPGMLEKHTLEEALALYCAGINNNTTLQMEVQFHGETDDLDKSVILLIYRIAQELIQNIIKHAHATIADIQVMRNGDLLNMIVEDNGIGFDPGETTEGIGLFNMEYRVQAMGGYMSVDSIKGASTTIFIEFDLKKLKLEV